MDIEDNLDNMPNIIKFKNLRTLDKCVRFHDKKDTEPVTKFYQCIECAFKTQLNVNMSIHMQNYHKSIPNKSEDKNNYQILQKDAENDVEDDTLEKIPQNIEFKRKSESKNNDQILQKDAEDDVYIEDDTLEKMPKDTEFKSLSEDKNNDQIWKKDAEDDVENDTLEKMPKNTEFKRLRSLDRRFRLHNNNTKPIAPYQCSECTFQTMEKSHLILHMKTVHDLKYGKVKLKQKSNRKNFVYICSECSFETKLLKNFERHRESHQKGSKLYKCNTCSFSTNFKGSLKRHSILHLKIKLFSCKVCPYSSNRKENLKIHILKHTSDDKKAFKCGKCNFETIWKGSYTRHMNSHNSQKTPCPYCDFKCIRKSYLRRHIYNMHENIKEPREVVKPIRDDKKAYKCNKCNFETIWKGNYNRHMKTHESWVALCPYCDFKCTQESNLRKHLHKKHKNDVLRLKELFENKDTQWFLAK